MEPQRPSAGGGRWMRQVVEGLWAERCPDRPTLALALAPAGSSAPPGNTLGSHDRPNREVLRRLTWFPRPRRKKSCRFDSR